MYLSNLHQILFYFFYLGNKVPTPVDLVRIYDKVLNSYQRIIDLCGEDTSMNELKQKAVEMVWFYKVARIYFAGRTYGKLRNIHGNYLTNIWHLASHISIIHLLYLAHNNFTFGTYPYGL